MSTETTETEEKLKFNEIKSGRHTAYGVLKDDDGNTFSIEVKGTNKADVEKFINYELSQANNGEGITTEIKTLTAKEQKALTKATKAKTDEKTDDELYKPTSWHGISVKVKLLELKNKTDKPSKIRFTIDPPIGTGKSMDFPVDQQKDANIQCTVTNGKVTVELYEFKDLTKTTSTPRGSKTASPAHPAVFNEHQSKLDGTSDWNIKVLGDTSSTFTLSLDIVVS